MRWNTRSKPRYREKDDSRRQLALLDSVWALHGEPLEWPLEDRRARRVRRTTPKLTVRPAVFTRDLQP